MRKSAKRNGEPTAHRRSSANIHPGRIALLLVLVGLLSACIASPFASPTPQPTATQFFTLTPSPTATLTPTPTAIIPARDSTPLPAAQQPITIENASQLVPFARWGRGLPQQIAWTPDSRRFAVASTQGLTLYDGATLDEIFFIESRVALRSAAISPDGKIIAAGNENGKIYLWNAADGSPIQILSGHQLAVLSLAFSPDGSQLASGSWDHTVRLWNSGSWSLTKTLEGHRAGILALAFTPGGDRLISWSPQEQPLVWTIPDGKPAPSMYIGIDAKRRSASSVAFSPRGDLMAVDQDVRVRIFRTSDNTTLSQLTHFSGPVEKVAVSNDGEYVVTLEQERLRTWQGSNGLPLAEYPLTYPEQHYELLSLSPDGRTLAAVGVSLASWVLDAAGELALQAQRPLEYSSGVRLSASFAPQGTALTTTFLTSQVWERLLGNGAARLLFALPGAALNSLALSPDQTLAAAGLADRSISVQRVESGETLQTLKGDSQAAIALAFSPDGRLLASASGRQPVRIWQVPDGQPLATLETETRISALEFSPDGTYLAAVDGGNIHLWQVADGSLAHTFTGFALAFSPDGQTLAAASYRRLDPIVTLLQVNSGAELRTLPAQGNSLAFSPNGQLVAAAGLEITLWNAATGEKLASFPSPNPYCRVFFSPNGSLLALSAWDGSLYLWGVP